MPQEVILHLTSAFSVNVNAIQRGKTKQIAIHRCCSVNKKHPATNSFWQTSGPSEGRATPSAVRGGRRQRGVVAFRKRAPALQCGCCSPRLVCSQHWEIPMHPENCREPRLVWPGLEYSQNQLHPPPHKKTERTEVLSKLCCFYVLQHNHRFQVA